MRAWKFFQIRPGKVTKLVTKVFRIGFNVLNLLSALLKKSHVSSHLYFYVKGGASPNVAFHIDYLGPIGLSRILIRRVTYNPTFSKPWKGRDNIS